MSDVLDVMLDDIVCGMCVCERMMLCVMTCVCEGCIGCDA